jgi:hypothetical protein
LRKKLQQYESELPKKLEYWQKDVLVSRKIEAKCKMPIKLQTVQEMRESWLVNGESVSFNKLMNMKRGECRARGSKSNIR